MTMKDDAVYNAESAFAGLNFSIREFERKKAQLFRNDGQQIFSDAEHAERIAELLKPVERQYQRVLEKIETAKKEAARLELQISNRPNKRLTRSQMEEANLQAMFIKEDCESMELTDLAERLEVVIDEDDPVAIFLWHRYADKRLEAEVKRQGAGNRHVRALGAMVRRLEEMNRDPALDQKRERAKELRKVAAEVFTKANRRYQEVTGAEQKAQRGHSEFMRSAF